MAATPNTGADDVHELLAVVVVAVEWGEVVARTLFHPYRPVQLRMQFVLHLPRLSAVHLVVEQHKGYGRCYWPPEPVLYTPGAAQVADYTMPHPGMLACPWAVKAPNHHMAALDH